jgi:CHAD domain-containing protein
MKNKIQYLYKKHTTDFIKYLKLTFDRCGEEDIHELRVSIKKIRSILGIAQILSNCKISRKYHNLIYDNIFKYSGKVREIQINSNLLKQLHSDLPQSYLNYLRRSQRYYTKKMISEIEIFDNNRFSLNNKSIFTELDKIDDSTSLNYSITHIQYILVRIKSLLHNDPENIKLHKIRKQLRSINEVMKIVYEIKPEHTINELFFPLKHIRDKIGLWHDHDVLFDSLKAFSFRNKNNPEQNKVLTLQFEIRKETESMQSQIIQLLNDFFHKKRDPLKNIT